jgi:hypothetical protein
MLHLIAAIRSSALATSWEFHAGFQPLPATRGCAPAPAAGAVLDVPCPASTNARNRPTVTS